MGRQLGEAERDGLKGFVSLGLQRLHQMMRISSERIAAIVSECTAKTEQYAPELLMELRGMSESSGVPFNDLMFLQLRNQFTPAMADSGCTSFSIGRTASTEGRALVGQNWDNDPALDEYTVVLTRKTDDQPALMTVTQVGLTAYVGFNSAGIGACLNTLPAPSRAIGVPHYFTLRRIFESTSLEQAVDAVRSADRAIPANIMLTTPQGPANLEVTIDNVHVLRDEQNRVVVHTNHCLHPDLIHLNSQFGELIQSGPRKRRMDQQLCARQSGLNLEALKEALRDHDGFPRSICRHQNDDPQHGNWETVFSIIMDPQEGRMHVSRGTPCSNSYEIYEMKD